MNTNQKIRRIGGIVVLLILCGMLLPVFCKNSRAAEVTHYYVYLDDARYEVTKDENLRKPVRYRCAGFDFKRNLRRAHAGILFRCVWRGNDRK